MGVGQGSESSEADDDPFMPKQKGSKNWVGVAIAGVVLAAIVGGLAVQRDCHDHPVPPDGRSVDASTADSGDDCRQKSIQSILASNPFVTLSNSPALQTYEVSEFEWNLYATCQKLPEIDRARRDYPIRNVKHRDATAFCEWLGGSFHLPTTDGWKDALRASHQKVGNGRFSIETPSQRSPCETVCNLVDSVQEWTSETTGTNARVMGGSYVMNRGDVQHFLEVGTLVPISFSSDSIGFRCQRSIE